MTPTEAVDLVELVASMCPAMRMEEKTGEAWYLLLGDLEFAEAVAAAAIVGREQRFIAPADIRAQVTASRKRAAEARASSVAVALAVPDADPDDVPGYLAALRAGRLTAAPHELLRTRDLRALASLFPRPDSPTRPHAALTAPQNPADGSNPAAAHERPSEARVCPQTMRNQENPDAEPEH